MNLNLYLKRFLRKSNNSNYLRIETVISTTKSVINIRGDNDKMTIGRLYSFEGPECAGKSTAIQMVKDILEKQGYDVVVTREPGGTPLAEKMREIAFDKVPDRTELLLMCAARDEHYQMLIKPHLDEGYIVLCDRHMDSTTVYQFMSKGKSYDEAVKFHNFIFGKGLEPNRTFLLDIPTKEIMKRMGSRGVENKFDAKDSVYHSMIRTFYLELALKESDRFVVINGLYDKEWIAEYISRKIISELSEVK